MIGDTYRYDEPMSRDFPGAPNRLRVPAEWTRMMGNYVANCPPANLNPPTITSLLLPASTVVSSAVAPSPPSDGIGILGLLSIGFAALFLFNSPKRNGGRRRNVEMGYYVKGGGFHPIRASYDYDGRRAGEGRSKKRHKAKKKARRRRR